MALSYYLTHPEVLLHPAQPPTEWVLSSLGRQRLMRCFARDIFTDVDLIVTSDEAKTTEMATHLAYKLDVPLLIDPNSNENYRTTPVMSASAFEELFAAMYAEPAKSSGGWEPALDTQKRIVAAIDQQHRAHPDKSILFAGHGTSGTALKCHLAQRPISREEDQRSMAAEGGGNVFAFDWAKQRLVSDWVALEDWT
ncbi:histidine phosphatase family protein [Maritalea myrionectae]|nr:histidine phosphatase family protein [Maritalea myrionectae]